MRWLSKAEEPLYALLRFVAGILFACHGAQKVLGAFANIPGQAITSPYGGQDLLDGVLIEPRITLIGVWALVGGLLIAAGLFTRVAAFGAGAAMLFNYLLFHAPGGLWPIVNRGVPAQLYCFIFFYVAARGPGRFAIDKEPAARG